MVRSDCSCYILTTFLHGLDRGRRAQVLKYDSQSWESGVKVFEDR